MAASNRKIDSNSYSVGEFFRKPISYRVPVYQRDFAWSSEQIDTLWDDLTKALSEARKEYFLGAIVISYGDEDKRREIIDGQQRLISLSMILAAIARHWKVIGDERRFTGVFRDYLGTEDRRTGDVIPKLTLNETNDPTFQDVVLQGKLFRQAEKKLWPASNKLLDDAQQRINTKLSEWLKQFDDKESALLDLEEFLANNTNMIVIEAGDESDAFIIFETLNDRGLELAVSDLVKNYLFSLADTHLERFKKAWTEIVVLVGSENTTQFLRHFWLSEYEQVRERELYRAFREKVKSRTSARQFMEKLRKVADYYSALSNPEHIYWNNFQPEFRNYLDALLLFRVTQYRPVMLSAMEKFTPELASKLMRLLMVISFRYTVISSLGTGNLERIYASAALAIRNGQVRTISEVFDYLKEAYVDDERFSNNFEQKSPLKDEISRYILVEINNYLEQDPEHTVFENRVTLEHILPKNPNANWADAVPDSEDVAFYATNIGNLTLLEKGRNRGIGNASFEEKRDKAFRQSSLALNNPIALQDKWTHQEIERRAKELAKFAKHIWRVDY